MTGPLRRLLAALTPKHRHRWRECAWNPYMIAAEQKCECGARRHRYPDPHLPLGEDQPWVDGPHPIAESLRAQGKVYTDNYFEKSHRAVLGEKHG